MDSLWEHVKPCSKAPIRQRKLKQQHGDNQFMELDEDGWIQSRFYGFMLRFHLMYIVLYVSLCDRLYCMFYVLQHILCSRLCVFHVSPDCKTNVLMGTIRFKLLKMSLQTLLFVELDTWFTGSTFKYQYFIFPICSFSLRGQGKCQRDGREFPSYFDHPPSNPPRCAVTFQ